jgi:hypothetical protein
MDTAVKSVHCAPELNIDLGFRYEIPADWEQMILPGEDPDFDNPVFFLALSVSCATYGVAAFSVAARPAYDDGTVYDWARWLCEQNEIALTALMPSNVGDHRAWLAEGTQANEAGPTVVRAFFLEDGGRLYNLSLMAAEVLWPSVEPILMCILASFRLDVSHGGAAAFVSGAA